MSLDATKARSAASTSSSLRAGMELGEAQELTAGWFFPTSSATVGCNGIIVNKHTGKLFHLGSAFPVERDLALYDRGYQFDRYDLTIIKVRRRKQTLHALGKVRLDVIEPTLEHGIVWRVPRARRRCADYVAARSSRRGAARHRRERRDRIRPSRPADRAARG